MLPSDAGISEAPSAALAKDQPNVVTLKDAFKTSVLIITLSTAVLYILLAWYFFVLKPALFENMPMEIKLTKKLFSEEPVSKALEFKKETKTEVAENDVKPLDVVVEQQEKPKAVQRNHPIRRTNATKKKAFIKSEKSNKAVIEKVATVQIPDSSNLQTNYSEENKKKEISSENIRVWDDREENRDKNEAVAQETKPFAVKWKESILTPATQSVCSQVQIALNQCPN